MTKADRDKRIAEIMHVHGIDESEAEFVLAVELGEIQGDIKAIKSGD